MTIPNRHQMDELVSRLTEMKNSEIYRTKKADNEWYTYEGMMEAIKRHGPGLALQATGAAAKKGVTTAASAAGASTGFAMIPVGAAIAPWITAVSIGFQEAGIRSLHDLKDRVRHGDDWISCSCGHCTDNIDYILSKHERKIAVSALGPATFGVSSIGQMLWSIGKSFHKPEGGRPKERVSKQIVESALGGCSAAIATVFHLAGGNSAEEFQRATIIIIAEDGWAAFKKCW